jgi:hypothetical protein
MSDDTRKMLLIFLMMGSFPLWPYLRLIPYRYVIEVFP